MNADMRRYDHVQIEALPVLTPCFVLGGENSLIDNKVKKVDAVTCNSGIEFYLQHSVVLTK